ncbi:3995_t:CDS:2 [Diversispora eburnea]|uniref:3995_t:CDS:1 n=1 Tax=Diversispora eburnea TaxID=1213867 RepID=A0A9N9AZJ0_9GLOM|nr:3995_t:CDS:2 [Diversispora eburnea]
MANGLGVEASDENAFELYSEKGNSVARFNVGLRFKLKSALTGNVNTMNSTGKSYEFATENDDSINQYMVGKYLCEGCGTMQDIKKAIYWLNKIGITIPIGY